MFNIYRFIAAAGAAVCLTAGCMKEMSDPLIIEEAVVELIQEPSPQTKSSVGGFTADAVNNLTVALFDNSTGMLADALYFNPASAMKLPLVKGKTYAIYAVANVGDVSSVIRSGYANMTAFKSFPLSFASFAGVTAGGFPMASKAVSIVSGGASAAPVTLERLVAKYTVNIDRSALAAGSTVTVKSMNVRQAALSARPFADASERKAGTVSDGDYAVDADITALNGGGAITLYLLENRQGTLLPSNTDPKNKIPAAQAQKDVCTYLEMVCAYAKTDKRADNVTYRIYLGEDNITDFSIVRNSTYTLTLKPTDAGIDQPSWRLDPGDILTWTHSLSVAPSDPTIKVGGTQAFTATYTTRKFVNGHEEVSAQTEDDVTSSATWTSQNTSVATLSSSTATGVAAGSSYIKASYNGYEGGSTLTVEDDITYDDEIVVSGPASVKVGGTAAFTATKNTYKYVNGVKVETPTATTDVTASAVWSSSNTGVATVTAGTVKGIASGTATITATINKGTANEKSHSVTVTVADDITYTHELKVAPKSASIKINGTQAFTATYFTYTLVNGELDDTKTTWTPVTASATWSSNKTSVATVSAGTATGKGEGTATITAAYEGCSDTATITVDDDIDTYGTPEVTISYNPATLPTAGGASTPTVKYSQKVTYLSGKTKTLTQENSTAIYSFSGSATGFNVDSSTGEVSAQKNTGNARSVKVTVTVKVNDEEGSATATVSQNGDGVSSYGNPVIKSFTYNPNPMGAAAGNATPTVTYTQDVIYLSGDKGELTEENSTATYSFSGSASGFNVNSSTGVVSAEKNTGNARSVEVTMTLVVNGKSAPEPAKATVSQNGDSIVSAGDITITKFEYNPNPMGAAAGDATPTVKYSQTVTYASGDTKTLTEENSTATYSFSGEAEGFGVNSSTGVVHTEKNTGNARSVTVTATVTLNDKSDTKTVTVTQSKTEEDRIVSVSDITITKFEYKPETIDATGGTSTPTVEYSQTVTYESGNTKTLTQENSTAEFNFTGEAEGFGVHPSTGIVSAEKNTNIERSVDVIVTVALNDKIKTARATVKQGSKLIRITGKHTGTQFMIEASREIPQGSYTNVAVTFEVYYDKQLGKGVISVPDAKIIKPGNTTPNPQFSTAEITSWPSDAMSHSITGGSILSVSPTTVGDYTIIFEAGDFIKSYDDPVITLDSEKKLYVTKYGGSKYDLIKEFDISCSQTVRWNSGKTTDNPYVEMRFYGSNKDFIIDSNTGVLTTYYNGPGGYRSIDITVVATAYGKTSSKTFTVYQMY